MNRNEFYSALSDYNDEHTLQHSSRPHKYLYITNTGRYVYEEPKKSRPYSTPNDYTSSNKKTPSNVGQKMANAISEQKRIDKKHGVDIDAIDSDMKVLNSMYSDFANNEDKMTNDNLAKLNEAIEALEEKINGIQNAAVLKSYQSYMNSLKGNLNRVTDWAKRRGLLTDEIKHYGTKGQKWGVRRYQNKDGSLTPAGREHYGYGKGDRDTKDYSKNEKGLAVIPGARFVANSIRKKALDKKIENGKKLGRFEQKYAAEKLTIALKNDDKEMVDKLKNVLTSEEYDKAEERSQKLWNKRSIVKKAQKDRDRKKAEYEENLKKDPEHTHKYKSQDMNLAESMSDEDAAKLKSIEDKMVQVAKTSGTSSKEYKDLDAQYGKTEKSIVDKMNKADGTNRYKSINSYNDKNKNIEDIKKKIKPLTPDEEKRFSELSKNIDKDKSYYFRRDTGREPKELMKEADEYYDLRYRKKTNDDLDGMSPVDVQHRWNSLYDDSSKSGKNSKRKAAFDESTRVTGKEEAEAWKKLAAYYESQQKSGAKSSSKKPKYVDIDKNGNYIYKEDVEAHKRAEKAKKESDVDVNKVKKATYAGGLLGGFANLAWQKRKNKKG